MTSLLGFAIVLSTVCVGQTAARESKHKTPYEERYEWIRAQYESGNFSDASNRLSSEWEGTTNALTALLDGSDLRDRYFGALVYHVEKMRAKGAVWPLIRNITFINPYGGNGSLGDPLDGMYPVALALAAIGEPAVRAILTSRTQFPATEQELWLFTAVIYYHYGAERAVGRFHIELMLKRAQEQLDSEGERQMDRSLTWHKNLTRMLECYGAAERGGPDELPHALTTGVHVAAKASADAYAQKAPEGKAQERTYVDAYLERCQWIKDQYAKDQGLDSYQRLRGELEGTSVGLMQAFWQNKDERTIRLLGLTRAKEGVDLLQAITFASSTTDDEDSVSRYPAVAALAEIGQPAVDAILDVRWPPETEQKLWLYTAVLYMHYRRVPELGRLHIELKLKEAQEYLDRYDPKKTGFPADAWRHNLSRMLEHYKVAEAAGKEGLRELLKGARLAAKTSSEAQPGKG